VVDIRKLTKKAKSVIDTQGDKIAAGVDKATDLVDKKTKGKHRGKLDKVDELARKLDKTTKPGPAADTAGDEDAPKT
jgi:hypothetical protein